MNKSLLHKITTQPTAREGHLRRRSAGVTIPSFIAYNSLCQRLWTVVHREQLSTQLLQRPVRAKNVNNSR